MNTLPQLYHHSLALLTDLYQLTMAYGYWKMQSADKEATFHLYFRRNPFGGGFAVAAGLHYVIDYLQSFRFSPEDAEYLASLRGNDNKPLFDAAFLAYLRQLRFSFDVHAVPEGTVVFPQEPLLRVTGPLLQCQLVETALLNIINFQTLIATKSARVCLATRGEPVLEFGLRRAQGIDGALAASRAAYIGGCAATSNVLAGKLFGIPVRGTHAHSWVMSFDDELASFQAWARVQPNNSVFLVDTYNTLDGVRHAIQAGKWLHEQGHRMIGIRLDSGDLAYLSIEARRLLDEAGLTEASIFASNDLDENIINSLKDQGATINIWGVGTRLVTGNEQPALGGIYKLSAIRADRQSPWQHKIKLSEQTAKISTPGILQVRRFRQRNEYMGDAIYDTLLDSPSAWTIVDPLDMTRRKTFPRDAQQEDLLIPVVQQGVVVYSPPPLNQTRQRVQDQLNCFHAGVKRFVNPHEYPVGLERSLHDLKTELILEARGVTA